MVIRVDLVLGSNVGLANVIWGVGAFRLGPLVAFILSVCVLGCNVYKNLNFAD